jgi:hypothetical protein
MYIFLDLDGVATNFLSGACKLFKVDEKELMERWGVGQYDMVKSAMGIPPEEFYKTIEREGEQFWVDLERYPYADDLYNFCCGLAPTLFLTMPTFDANCIVGKIKWLQNWHGKDFRDYVLTPRKEAFAKWNSVLVDDRDDNIEKFKEKGGHGIVFPAVCNSRHAEKDNAVEIVKKELLEWHTIIVKKEFCLGE